VTQRQIAKRAALHLRAAAAHAALGGRKKGVAAIHGRAVKALREVAAALWLLEQHDEARRTLARKRGFKRRVEKTITRLAIEPTRRTNP